MSTGRVVAVDLPHYQYHLLSRWQKNLGLEAVILRLTQRWAWLVILSVLRCRIFLLTAVQIHYDFLSLILRQQMSLFHM
jgi:hypothetical protein